MKIFGALFFGVFFLSFLSQASANNLLATAKESLSFTQTRFDFVSKQGKDIYIQYGKVITDLAKLNQKRNHCKVQNNLHRDALSGVGEAMAKVLVIPGAVATLGVNTVGPVVGGGSKHSLQKRTVGTLKGNNDMVKRVWNTGDYSSTITYNVRKLKVQGDKEFLVLSSPKALLREKTLITCYTTSLPQLKKLLGSVLYLD